MADQTSEKPTGAKRGLFRLIADVPALIVQLVRDEIDSLKRELIEKLKGVAIGAGLIAGAGVMAIFALFALLMAAIYGLAASGLPTWAAALIVAGGLLLIALVFVAIAVAQFKRGDPAKTAQSIKKDVNTIKGIGKRD
jgi:TRAP-type C4-dicarboxylate transport system permease small subunit